MAVGTERCRAATRGLALPPQRDARPAPGGGRPVSAAGRALLRPGGALRAGAAAARAQVRAPLVAGLGAGVGERGAAAGRPGVRPPATRRGDALAEHAWLRRRLGRHALRRAGPAQYGADGARRLRTGSRAALRVDRAPALGRCDGAATGARSPKSRDWPSQRAPGVTVPVSRKRKPARLGTLHCTQANKDKAPTGLRGGVRALEADVKN
ncbi:mCG1031606 [Mus musculus]|nr:mCG1031606 [Mus musculus]